MDLRHRRETYNGAGEVLARAFELAVTPIIFGFLGYRLDRWVGTRPVFTVFLAVFALAYLTWKLVSGYEAEMRAHEAALSGPLAAPPTASGAPDG